MKPKKYLVCWDGGMGAGEWFWIEANSTGEINSALPEEFVVFESFPDWWEKSDMSKVPLPTHKLGEPFSEKFQKLLDEYETKRGEIRHGAISPREQMKRMQQKD